LAYGGSARGGAGRPMSKPVQGKDDDLQPVIGQIPAAWFGRPKDRMSR
jgi:hypothetical protein